MDVLEAGAGGRPMLLVHGFAGAKEDFAEALPRLATVGFHAVAPDLRGHGAAPHPSGQASYSLSLFADDIVAWADRLRWDRFVLLGHSMGGMAAQLVAIEEPERLRGLVLVNTGHGPAENIPPELVDAGHAPQFEQPDEWWRALAAFLEEIA